MGSSQYLGVCLEVLSSKILNNRALDRILIMVGVCERRPSPARNPKVKLGQFQTIKVESPLILRYLSG